MNILLKWLIYTVLVIAVLSLVGWAIIEGARRDVVVRCHTLQSQNEQFYLFYLTETEKMMCDDIGIIIDAPVGAPRVNPYGIPI